MKVLICLFFLCWLYSPAYSKERDPFNYSPKLLKEKRLYSKDSYLYIPEPESSLPEIKVKGVISFDKRIMALVCIDSYRPMILRPGQEVNGEWSSFTVEEITYNTLVVVFKDNRRMTIRFRK